MTRATNERGARQRATVTATGAAHSETSECHTAPEHRLDRVAVRLVRPPCTAGSARCSEQQQRRPNAQRQSAAVVRGNSGRRRGRWSTVRTPGVDQSTPRRRERGNEHQRTSEANDCAEKFVTFEALQRGCEDTASGSTEYGRANAETVVCVDVSWLGRALRRSEASQRIAGTRSQCTSLHSRLPASLIAPAPARPCPLLRWRGSASARI